MMSYDVRRRILRSHCKEPQSLSNKNREKATKAFESHNHGVKPTFKLICNGMCEVGQKN